MLYLLPFLLPSYLFSSKCIIKIVFNILVVIQIVLLLNVNNFSKVLI